VARCQRAGSITYSGRADDVVKASDYRISRSSWRAILRHCRDHLARYQRVRRLQFGELPKTISGKIRRVDLRTAEERAHTAGAGDARAPGEYRAEDFPDLRS
jgi:acetyl-CoA synthetase